MAIVTIVGAGMMGSAMSRPARDNGHTVRLVGTPLDREIIDRAREDGFHKTLGRPLPAGEELYQAEELSQALEGADLVIGGVSSFGVDWLAETLLPLLPAGARVLSITKGLRMEADGSLTPFPRYLASLRPDVAFCAVGGPCISFELMDGWDTHVAFCGEDGEAVEACRRLLATGYYHITPSSDVRGVECAVAMKNAYAMGVSLAIGAALRAQGEGSPEKYNPQAALFAQSVREMTGLIALMDGEAGSAAWAAGDLYVTVFGGRTRRLGTLLGSGVPFPEARERLAGVTLESVAITTLVMEALRRRLGEEAGRRFPLLEHLDAILNQGADAAVDWERFV